MQKSTKLAGLFPSTLVLTLILIAVVPLGTSLSGPQVMAPTNRYVNIIPYTIKTATTFSSTYLSWQPFYFTASFAYPKANTNYRCGSSIAQMNYVMPASRSLTYYLDVDTKLTTGVIMAFYADYANKFNLVVINTLTIQQGFMTYYFHYLTIPYGGMSFTPGQSTIESYPAIIASVPTATSSIYQSITGIDLIADSTFSYGFQIACSFASSTSVDVKITSIGTKTTTLYSINIMFFSFSNSQLATSPPTPALYTLGSFTSTSGINANLFWNNALVRPYNTLIGLSAFKVKGDSFFNYVTSVNTGVAALASSTNNNWLQFSFSVVVFQYQYCPDTIPYLMVLPSVCYDICPIRYASNASDYQCDACPTKDCYYCGANGKCTECSATVDFRYMNNATMRCVPLAGYYDNGVSQAVPCVAANCLTCTSATSCLTCYTGKYLSGTTCNTCMANCGNCTSATTCIACNPFYVYTSGACVANCSNITYCNTCTVSSGIVCSTCTTGYSLVGGVCVEVCGDGMMVTPEVCDDNNTIPGDGCSSTCQVEVGFFCNTASPTLCQPCSVSCNTCTSTTACTVCSIGYALVSGACILDCTVITYCYTCSYSIILPGTQCDSCQDGYELQVNNTCASKCGDGKRVPSEGCDDGGNADGDGCSATCTVETGYFCTDTFPSPSTCATCISDCNVCSDATTCTTCSTGYAYDNSTSPSTCKADCTLISNCFTCSYTVVGGTLCSACNDGYYDNGANGCIPHCGDGKIAAPEGCDDNNITNNDGCSSTCTVESGYFCTGTYPNPSTCFTCVSFCTTCSNNTSCTSCSTDYAYNSTLNTCTIDCTVISQCLTCDYFVSYTRCLTCNPGYHADSSSNICKTQCGDGWKTPDEACDDGNSIDGDGCSSTCLKEPAFFCVDAAVTGGVASTCTACLSFCLTCTTTTDCSSCQTAYSFNTTHCVIDCTPILLCTTCDYPGSLNCLSCSSGYYPVSNVCQPRCGDGILVTSESCDDGNINNNDGCSSNCTLESFFLCTNGTSNTTCVPCLAHCTDCTGNADDCQVCDTGYIYNASGTSIACDADCSELTNCLHCTFTACTNCRTGYTIDAIGACSPTCGDGIMKLGEPCDDGNTNNGDGCSNVCQLESNFQCVSVSMKSVCSLLSMDIAFTSLLKTPTANSIAVTYTVSPATLPAFKTIDWSTVVYQQSNLSVTFSSFTFDSSTGQLVINADYSQPLDAQLLQLGFMFPPAAPFNLLNATNTTTLLVADNNLALGVYSSDDYGQAGMVGYVAMGVSAAAAALFLLGFLKGKLVGLQCVTVFQLTFLSLLTCQNLSPSFYGLSYLGYSCGYNLKSLQKSQVSIGRRFSPVGHFEPFLDNYNLTSVLFLMPLILSLVFALVNRFCYKSSNEFLLKHSRMLRGEGCFYGLMFSAYEIVLSLGIEVLNMGAGMMGLAVGGLLTVVVVVFGVLLRCYPEFFGEFTEKFNKENCIQSGYYCILIGERVIVAGCLVMAFFNPLGAVIIGLLVIQIVLVVGKKPYAGERGWVRPFLNLLFSVLIQAVFILTPMLSSMPTMSRYAPLAVEGMLVAVLAYNIYYFVQQFRTPDQLANQVINQEEDLINEEMNKLGLFQKQMLNGPNISMLDKTNGSMAHQHQNDPDSPSRLSGNMLSDVKEKLNKVKLTTADPNNVSFAGSLDLQQDII